MKNLWRHVSSGLLFIPNVRCNKIWARDQIVNIHWIKEKGREFQKKHLLLIIAYAKGFDCVDHNKLWKILKEMGILDHLTCLLRNPYAGQEATARTGHGTTAWFPIGKEVCQGCILSPCLFNFYAEYIMQNVGQDKAQAGININWFQSIKIKKHKQEKYQ